MPRPRRTAPPRGRRGGLCLHLPDLLLVVALPGPYHHVARYPELAVSRIESCIELLTSTAGTGTEMAVMLVTRYNPAWPSWFEHIKVRLGPALGSITHRIEHIGSTAVPGMTAKPIIDVVIVIEPRTFPAVKTALEAIGYVHEGDKGLPGREAFKLRDADVRVELPAHHLYVCQRDGHELRKHLAFRDFMRSSPEWVRRLSALKWTLCETHDNDREAYMAGKDAMVREITKLGFRSS